MHLPALYFQWKFVFLEKGENSQERPRRIGLYTGSFEKPVINLDFYKY